MNNRLVYSRRVTASIQLFLTNSGNAHSAITKTHHKVEHDRVGEVLDLAAEAGLHKTVGSFRKMIFFR